jgi:long-chain acyl-CoA synthetase
MKSYDVPLLIETALHSNITDLLVERAAKTPNLVLFQVENEPNTWSAVTAAEFLEDVKALAKGFIACGIQPGQAVGIMSRTRLEWTLVDFALWFAGAVSVPVYESSAPAQIEWILGNSDSVALIVENGAMRSKFDEVRQSLPLVKQVWQLDTLDLAHLKTLGAEVGEDILEMRRKSATLDDLATIIYTSGTTGKPKGCELLHRGFVDLSRNAVLELPTVVSEGATTLLFLPLAHVFARFIEVLCIHGGVTVGHQPDARNIGPAMMSFKPTFLLAVPRVFEKVYNSAEQKAEASGKGDIFRKAAATAISYSKAMDNPRGPGLLLSARFRVFDLLVYRKLRAAMGGRVRFAVSGGAPLGPRLGHFFRAIGLIVLEGYGLTETTAPAMIARPDAIKIGKVGQLLPGCGIKVNEDGEILLRGTNTLRAYWRNPEATAESFEGDWFRTGDIGELDSEGFLSITGRKKELIVTAGGKNVAPAPMEDPLRADPLIGQAVVIGDQKPFVAALISLDPEMLPIWLKNQGIDRQVSLAEAAKLPIVLKAVQEAVNRVNKNFSQAESIRKFAILDVELTEASGHITPSLKVKRNLVITDFAEQINEIYQPRS